MHERDEKGVDVNSWREEINIGKMETERSGRGYGD